MENELVKKGKIKSIAKALDLLELLSDNKKENRNNRNKQRVAYGIYYNTSNINYS
jgi:hypothetical protein